MRRWWKRKAPVETHLCPRRAEVASDVFKMPDHDEWIVGVGLHGHQSEVERSCSYCGSLHPDTFMDWVRRGAEVGPTDKTYKAYITCPDDDPRKGETTVEKFGERSTITSVYGMEAKFYFQHLLPEQREEFVGLLNDRKINIGYPGHFYTLPFFCVPATRSSSGTG